MTRLSSDSESTTTTEYDLVTGGNILDEINTHVLEGILRELQRDIAVGAIGPDHDRFSSSTEQSEHSGVEQEEIPAGVVQQQADEHCQLYDNNNSDCYDSDEVDSYENSPRPFEESVYEFALSSARRLTTRDCYDHDRDYDLRPKFAILKHKTELLCRNSQDESSYPKTYPKTPDWFFNIPDARSPFPNFESNLTINDLSLSEALDAHRLKRRSINENEVIVIRIY